jgi:hypothetical protein
VYGLNGQQPGFLADIVCNDASLEETTGIFLPVKERIAAVPRLRSRLLLPILPWSSARSGYW